MSGSDWLYVVIAVLQVVILVKMDRTERARSRDADADFRSKLALIERERAERQRADLEADMARAVDPFAMPPANAEGKGET